MKKVKVDDGDPIVVKLDLLATELQGTGSSRRHQNVQDVKARKVKGSDLIFESNENFELIEIRGRLPNNALDTILCKVSGPVPFLVMKGYALGRGKPKDAYDIDYLIGNYPGGIDALKMLLKKDCDKPVVRKSLGRIRTKFETTNHSGPVDIVDFLQIKNSEDRLLKQRRAFENINELLNAFDIEKEI